MYTILYTNSGDTGRIQWNYVDNSVWITSPSALQSEDVISKLIKEKQTGKNGVFVSSHHLLKVYSVES